jgi:fission process protein 1
MPDKDSDKLNRPRTDLPAPEKLPSALQKIIDKADKEENFYDELYDGKSVIAKSLIALIEH